MKPDSFAQLRVLILITGLTLWPNAQGEELLRTSETWEGGDIAYPAGDAQITSVKLAIGENEITPFHCHPIPTLGYILTGTVEVETISGKVAQFSQGESVVEVMGTLHRGKASNGPVEIIVFYAGAKDIPTTVLGHDDPEHKTCKR